MIELPIKRFYLPFQTKVVCPKCASELELDMESNYISYPTLGQPNQFPVYCEKCDDWNDFFIEINFTVKVL